MAVARASAIQLKSAREIEIMARGGAILAATHAFVRPLVAPGVSTWDIDKQAEVLNCGIAAYEFEPDTKGLCVPALELWNHGAPLEAEGAPKTSAPDAMAGTR